MRRVPGEGAEEGPQVRVAGGPRSRKRLRLAAVRRTAAKLALQVVRLDLAVQRRALDLEDAGRLALVPVGVGQRLEDVLALDLLQRQRLVRRRPAVGAR